jgi:tetratricopeptide (TPR) repeat protein
VRRPRGAPRVARAATESRARGGVKSRARPPEAAAVGSLTETPLPRLLIGLHRDGFGGQLTVRADAVWRRFEWRGGQPVGIASSLPSERLARLLVGTGALDAALEPRVAATMKERGCGELQALAALGAVAPRALLLGLAEQLRRGLLASLAWRRGSFEFAPLGDAPAAPALPFDLRAALLEGTAAAWRSDEMLGWLGERAVQHPRLAPEAPSDWLPAEGPVRALLAQLDGRRPAYALLRERPEPESAAALWLLDALGALVWSETAASEEPAAAAPAPSGPRIEIVVRGGPSDGAAEAAKPAARAAAGGAGADEALRREIQELHGKLRQLTLWELLGVPRDADAKQVRRAYLGAAKRLHPDRLAQLGLLDVKEAANEVFAEIARAHEVLSDPAERERYEATLGDAPAADADRIAEAEASYVRGEQLLRGGNFRGALEFLERAVTLYPDEADYQAALGWALHRKTPAESERALDHFEKAFALGTQQAVWWLRGSLVAKSLGREPRAAELAARARALDPNARA